MLPVPVRFEKDTVAPLAIELARDVVTRISPLPLLVIDAMRLTVPIEYAGNTGHTEPELAVYEPPNADPMTMLF